MMTTSTTVEGAIDSYSAISLPRIAIRFCVKCKWNLRAAYYAQELLQTFDLSIGEICLVPVTGGVFDITVYHAPLQAEKDQGSQESSSEVLTPGTSDADVPSIDSPARHYSPDEPVVYSTLVWERKRDGGFPETKELKSRVRNIIDPQKDMGHIDRSLKKKDGTVVSDDSVSNSRSETVGGSVAEMSQATGGESLQYGSNLKPLGAEAAKENDDSNQSTQCEDCK